ncbi:helix-turn-helix transcriptional regulator [Ensifer adhaerens]
MDTTSEMMTALRAGRALLGLSQEELAALAGVSRQVVVRIEKCEGNVLVDTIEKVRSALEAEGVVFIDGEGTRGPGGGPYACSSAADQCRAVDRLRARTRPHQMRYGRLDRKP